jgi:hypothetical protein
MGASSSVSGAKRGKRSGFVALETVDLRNGELVREVAPGGGGVGGGGIHRQTLSYRDRDPDCLPPFGTYLARAARRGSKTASDLQTNWCAILGLNQ